MAKFKKFLKESIGQIEPANTTRFNKNRKKVFKKYVVRDNTFQPEDEVINRLKNGLESTMNEDFKSFLKLI